MTLKMDGRYMLKYALGKEKQQHLWLRNWCYKISILVISCSTSCWSCTWCWTDGKRWNVMVNNDEEKRGKIPKDGSEISGEWSVESMLLVERGLRELTLLKIENAVAFAMAHQRRPNKLKSTFTAVLATWVCLKKISCIFFLKKLIIFILFLAIIVDELNLPIKGHHTWELYGKFLLNRNYLTNLQKKN